MSKHLWGRWPAIVLFSAAVLATACSSTTEAQMPDGIDLGTMPAVTDGARCTDPTGDISEVASDVAGTLSEPAGIDIVGVTAEVDETNLTITYTTAGSIAAVAAPEFIVSQGPSGQAVSFELRAKPVGVGGSVNLITWVKDTGGLKEAAPRPLPANVTVTDTTFRFTVALTEIPKIATLIWQFGVNAQLPGGDYVLDDCNNLGDQEASTAPPGSGPTTTALELPVAALGEPLTHRNGAVVTAFEVQKPPTNAKVLEIAPDEGNEAAVADVQVCAGEQPVSLSAGSFGVKTSSNNLWAFWNVPQTAKDPSFPASRTLPPGECVRGWITFQVPITDSVIEVFYSPDSDGGNYLTWTVV